MSTDFKIAFETYFWIVMPILLTLLSHIINRTLDYIDGNDTNESNKEKGEKQ